MKYEERLAVHWVRLYNGVRLNLKLRCNMTITSLRRQFITDAEGNPIAVILPLEEFALVEDILDQKSRTTDEADRLAQIERAAQDPLFMADLRETMSAFAETDAEWWEPTQRGSASCWHSRPAGGFHRLVLSDTNLGQESARSRPG